MPPLGVHLRIKRLHELHHRAFLSASKYNNDNGASGRFDSHQQTVASCAQARCESVDIGCNLATSALFVVCTQQCWLARST